MSGRVSAGAPPRQRRTWMHCARSCVGHGRGSGGVLSLAQTRAPRGESKRRGPSQPHPGAGSSLSYSVANGDSKHYWGFISRFFLDASTAFRVNVARRCEREHVLILRS